MTTQTLPQPTPVPARTGVRQGQKAGAPAPAWAALGVRTSDCADSTLAAVLGRRFGPATQLRLSGGGGQLLAPVPDRQQALRLAHQVRADLGDRVWISVAWRPYEELGGGVCEMANVLTVVCALNRRPGVYQLGDVAVEYAVASNPAVSRFLAALIEPVVIRPELLETLKALIAADGNRARAASELIIHRSTIDYRLQRIEQLTGHSPTSVRGMRTLCTALAARALLRLQATSPQQD
ncbi:helix-turn-helix domain-containing protein [Streptomyces canus]|uniref:PucR family transcriptional regulator n=1 Tax=Streptomyces canus TaxID=58343 RepID=UPI0036EDCFEF